MSPVVMVGMIVPALNTLFLRYLVDSPPPMFDSTLVLDIPRHMGPPTD